MSACFLTHSSEGTNMTDEKKKTIERIINVVLGFLGALFGAIFGGQSLNL